MNAILNDLVRDRTSDVLVFGVHSLGSRRASSWIFHTRLWTRFQRRNIPHLVLLACLMRIKNIRIPCMCKNGEQWRSTLPSAIRRQTQDAYSSYGACSLTVWKEALPPTSPRMNTKLANSPTLLYKAGPWSLTILKWSRSCLLWSMKLMRWTATLPMWELLEQLLKDLNIKWCQKVDLLKILTQKIRMHYRGQLPLVNQRQLWCAIAAIVDKPNTQVPLHRTAK